MEKKNILIVASHLFIGGAEVVIANLCRYLNRKKFNVSVCCLKTRGILGDDLFDQGYDVFSLPEINCLNVNYFSFLQLKKIIENKNIQIVHSHTTHSLIDTSLCKLMHKNLKSIHTFHFGNYPNLNKRYLFLEKIFCRVPDQLIAVGNEQKKSIKDSFNIKDSKIQTIWNGVPGMDINLKHSIVDKFRTNDNIIIGTVCTLIEQKGLTYLLETALSLKRKKLSAVFLIAGEGHLRESLENKIVSLGLEDYVFLLGWIKNAATEFIPKIDIFFLPSLWEAMSVVVLEAMRAEKPVVVTNVGENIHVIDHENNGMIVEKKNVDEMIVSLEKLIRNKKLRKHMGTKAAKKAETYCSVDKMIEHYEKLYFEVLNR